MSQAAEIIHTPAAARPDAFDWQDPLDLEGELTQDEKMVRDTARSYAQDKLLPRVLKAFRDASLDHAIAHELAALGLLSATLPDEYLGSAFCFVAYWLNTLEL